MGKHTFMVCPVSGTNTGTMIFDCLEMTDVYDRIITSDIVDFSLARHVGHGFHVLPWASSAEFIPVLSEVLVQEGVEVLIPGSDWELKRIAEHRRVFEKMGVHLLVNSDEVLTACFDKNLTANFLKENGFHAPTTVELPRLKEVASKDALKMVTECMEYPFLIKPNQITGGSMYIEAIQDREDFFEFYDRYVHMDTDFIAQEYIDAPDEEYTLGVMSDPEGAIISSFAMNRDLSTGRTRKLSVQVKHPRRGGHEHIIVSGGYTQGTVDDYPEIREFAEEVAAKLDSRGPINIQCRRRGGKLYIFEINPRFSGTTNIRGAMGHNDVLLIYNAVVNGFNMGQQNYSTGSAVRGQRIAVRETGSIMG